MSVRPSVWRAVSDDQAFRGCRGKRMYLTGVAARKAAADLTAETGHDARAYRCTQAPVPHFHVSSHEAKPGRAA